MKVRDDHINLERSECNLDSTIHSDNTVVFSTMTKAVIDAKDAYSPVPYPKHVFLIIGNELCERFSFYGFRTILYIYLSRFVRVDKDAATAIYHGYLMLCYFTPLLGAILADGFVGLYRTIVSLSVVYLIGELIVTLTSMAPLGAPNLVGPLCGLAVIALGTGGIKPCVGAFGANQFVDERTAARQVPVFFSAFYVSINVGSTLGTLLVPLLRADVKCFGGRDCYALAFGVPAALMLVALLLFVAGTRLYTRDTAADRQRRGNAIALTCGCIGRALYNRTRHIWRQQRTVFKSDTSAAPLRRDHWLDYADDAYALEVIDAVKAFVRLLLVLTPLPLFWALYDQQGSRWTEQAQQLSGRLGVASSSFTIKPEQFQVANPLLVVLLVPVFDYVVYPACARLHLLNNLLQRMAGGMALTVIAFLIAAALQWRMQSAAAALNRPNQLRLLNLSPCHVSVSRVDTGETLVAALEPAAPSGARSRRSAHIFDRRTVDTLFGQEAELQRNATLVWVTGECGALGTVRTSLSVERRQLPKTLLLELNSAATAFVATDLAYNQRDQVIGASQLTFASFRLDAAQRRALRPRLVLNNHVVATAAAAAGLYSFSVVDVESPEYDAVRHSGGFELDPMFGRFVVEAVAAFNDSYSNQTAAQLLLTSDDFWLEICGRYTVLLYRNTVEDKLDYALLVDVAPNGLHLAWQLVQIVVMTMGEIMFSISGLAFVYSQAPASMKSVLLATWYITIALGNLIVVLVAKARVLTNQVNEYLLFAGLLAAATALFALIAYFYQSAAPSMDDAKDARSNRLFISSDGDDEIDNF